MTTSEFNNAFDIGYNAIAGQSAPSIDIYEKSYYLTKAQLEIVKNYYNAGSNPKGKGFEKSTKRRVDLKELIKDYKTDISQDLGIGLSTDSRFFNIPNNVFLIIQESTTVESTGCDNGLVIKVKPVTHDEFNTQRDNPFKKPGNKVTWRLDMSEQSNNQVVEIISPYNSGATSLSYQMRYLELPTPIILDDLDTVFPSESLTIDGVNVKTECKLHKELHPEIVDRAIELALADYKAQNLEARVQLHQRNE